jgi:hypothetical protein
VCLAYKGRAGLWHSQYFTFTPCVAWHSEYEPQSHKGVIRGCRSGQHMWDAWGCCNALTTCTCGTAMSVTHCVALSCRLCEFLPDSTCHILPPSASA